ncbi:peroxisomal acyl-coenzyme A oxidase 1-like [Dysidea avara]|uniref:peroxisomal acyl-coenzyme A oxidase 1-like n=1 Tax=Dysidea avara TaxID=196820 RepID=UPI003333F4A3
MASELSQERSRSSLDVEQLTNILDGGASVTKIRRETEAIVFSDPVFNNEDTYYLSTEEQFMRDTEKAVHFTKKINQLKPDPVQTRYLRRALNTVLPVSVHFDMFVPNLEGQANEKQKAQWLDVAKKLEIIGAYGQTEMGHGTYIRGLETTATYDSTTQEFVLNSPTLTSLKWWPGGLGHTSTHAVVIARLIIKDKDYGIHHFIVPLRDLENHKPLPGITLGDIGPKFGSFGIDNGFLKMNNVRIPRDNMLMGHAKVDPDGTYTKPSHERLSYGTMMLIRTGIVSLSADGLSRAVTIATRYSIIRRQTPAKPDGPEVKILDYVTQQHKLLPQIANAYALRMAGSLMKQFYLSSTSEISKGVLTSLPVLHATSAGLKAFSSEMACHGMEICRLACGGMGYSLASGIPYVYMTTLPAQTYEGENTVLYLQTARFLRKLYSQRLPQSQLSQDVKYLASDYPPQKTWTPRKLDHVLDADTLVEAYRQRAMRLVSRANHMTGAALAKGEDEMTAWNLASVEWVRAARAHCHLSVLQMFLTAINSATASANNQKILTALCNLFALHRIAEIGGEFQLDGYMSSNQIDMVQDQVYKLLVLIRQEAVPLVDAFDYKDELLCSVAGRYDGDVYNHLYQWALKSPRNKSEVHPAYHQYLKKLIKPPNAKL